MLRCLHVNNEKSVAAKSEYLVSVRKVGHFPSAVVMIQIKNRNNVIIFGLRFFSCVTCMFACSCTLSGYDWNSGAAALLLLLIYPKCATCHVHAWKKCQNVYLLLMFIPQNIMQEQWQTQPHWWIIVMCCISFVFLPCRKQHILTFFFNPESSDNFSKLQQSYNVVLMIFYSTITTINTFIIPAENNNDIAKSLHRTPNISDITSILHWGYYFRAFAAEGLLDVAVPW